MNTSTYYKGGLGAIAPESKKKKKNVEKMDAFPFHVLMWIQIRAKGDPGVTPRFFLLKWCKLAQSERSKIHYYQPKNNNFKDNKSTIVKMIVMPFTNTKAE